MASVQYRSMSTPSFRSTCLQSEREGVGEGVPCHRRQMDFWILVMCLIACWIWLKSLSLTSLSELRRVSGATSPALAAALARRCRPRPRPRCCPRCRPRPRPRPFFPVSLGSR
eukprot:240717-Hanusia_phi.AAC.1